MIVSAATSSSFSLAISLTIFPCLRASSAYSLEKQKILINKQKLKSYVAYSLTISAPCARYSFPVSAAAAAFSLSTSAYSELTLAASAAFSLITSVASWTFSWKEIHHIIKN